MKLALANPSESVVLFIGVAATLSLFECRFHSTCLTTPVLV